MVAIWLDIIITMAYYMSYDKEHEKNDDIISIRCEKTAVYSG